MSRKKHDEYCCENKYNEDVANALKSKSNKVHYKLYQCYKQRVYLVEQRQVLVGWQGWSRSELYNQCG